MSASSPRIDINSENRIKEEAILEDLLGKRTLDFQAATRFDPVARLWFWLGPLLITLVAGLARFIRLGTPNSLVFDETYYVKGAWSFLKFGYEVDWTADPNAAFEAGDPTQFITTGDYVVHPPIGKLMIALGIGIGGQENAWAWRLTSAVLGTLAVLLVILCARKIFASNVFALIAGVLMAIDGVAIVHSRTALLDGVLMFWVLAAFYFILLDREQSRRRLAKALASTYDSATKYGPYGPRLGFRWWRLAAAITLGLACGTKWSAVYFVVVFGILSVAWDLSARRKAGIQRWVLGGLLRDGLPAFLGWLLVLPVVYLASWLPWFTHKESWGRNWAELNPSTSWDWVPGFLDPVVASLRSFWAYHAQMLDFHSGLSTPHSYQANPWGWMLQLRPTAFYWDNPQGPGPNCSVASCASAVTSIGNPFIWWLATAALLVALFFWLVKFDWRASAVLSGVIAGWVPWLFFTERTIFQFYTIVFAPWMYLALAYALWLLWEKLKHGKHSALATKISITALLGVLLAFSVYFYPLWSAIVVPYDFWHAHMWFDNWI